MLTGRGMLPRGFVVALEPDRYPKHAAIERAIVARPRQWEAFTPDGNHARASDDHAAEPTPAPVAEAAASIDGLMPHQVEAILAARTAAATTHQHSTSLGE